MPGSQERTQVHFNKHKRSQSTEKCSKKHKHHREARGSSSQGHRHSQRGVLSDTAAQNRHNRRVENSENMSASAGKRNNKDLSKQLQDQIQKLQEQMEENQRNYQQELAKARKSGQKAKKRRGSSAAYASKVPISAELGDRVAEVAGTELWRTCKFLADELYPRA